MNVAPYDRWSARDEGMTGFVPLYDTCLIHINTIPLDKSLPSRSITLPLHLYAVGDFAESPYTLGERNSRQTLFMPYIESAVPFPRLNLAVNSQGNCGPFVFPALGHGEEVHFHGWILGRVVPMWCKVCRPFLQQ